jgi:hypothetical protein
MLDYAHDHFLDIAYVVTALCVTYKLAFIIAQTHGLPVSGTAPLRICAAITGTLVLLTALVNFGTPEVATWLDVSRNLAWCGVLVCLIWLLHAKSGRW